MGTKPLTQTTGRRKESVARVRLRPGTGIVTVNGRSFENYFPTAMARMTVSEPLRLTNTEEAFDIDATIHGGGISGQAGALRMGIARSLIELDPEQRAALKKAGLQHELIIIEGAPHTFHLQPKQRDLRPLVLGFFDKHLKR